jgi:hypothetical protein
LSAPDAIVSFAAAEAARGLRAIAHLFVRRRPMRQASQQRAAIS